MNVLRGLAAAGLLAIVGTVGWCGVVILERSRRVGHRAAFAETIDASAARYCGWLAAAGVAVGAVLRMRVQATTVVEVFTISVPAAIAGGYLLRRLQRRRALRTAVEAGVVSVGCLAGIVGVAG